MIKYQDIFEIVSYPELFNEEDGEMKKDFKWAIEHVLSRQIDEDNKRFLEYVGEDEVLNNDPHDVFEDADKIAKNQLRAELRDKVNKNDK